MKLYEKYLLEEQNKLQGIYSGAPWYMKFPRMGTLIPTIDKGRQIMLLAGSGIGKTHAFIGLVLMPVYFLIKSIGYKARFYIYLLEDPAELFYDRLFCRVLYEVSGEFYDPLDLHSKKEKLIPQHIKDLYPKVEEIVDDILSYCQVVDNQFNPTGIYKSLRSESAKYGEHVWEDKEFEYKKSDGSTYKETIKVYSKYIPKDDTHFIVDIDNLNNLAEEKGGDVRDSINLWTRDYARLQITKHWNWTVWDTMQTALETDKQQFTNTGRQIVEKLEPNISALGDNKVCVRNMHLVLALFSPNRFGIQEYEGYNIDRLEDNFRALLILKSNFSISNRKIPFLFNGASSLFLELPKSEDMNEAYYRAIETNSFNLKNKFIEVKPQQNEEI